MCFISMELKKQSLHIGDAGKDLKLEGLGLKVLRFEVERLTAFREEVFKAHVSRSKVKKSYYNNKS